VGAPFWTLAQWASKDNLADRAVTHQRQLDADRFEIVNSSKRVAVDCRRGEVELGLFASACYEHSRRTGESWPHLLMSASLTDVRYPARICHIAELQRLTVALDCRLERFADKQPDADPHRHAAQFQLFLYVQNLTPGDDGFGDMLWFGIPIFDNRYPLQGEHYQRDGGKADASGKFIYSMPSDACLADGNGFIRNNRLLAGDDARWIGIRADVLPYILRAYTLARTNGYLTKTDPGDLYVSGLNIGWEMPGAYDGTMRIRKFSVRATPVASTQKP
jgi:hypothetical protein